MLVFNKGVLITYFLYHIIKIYICTQMCTAMKEDKIKIINPETTGTVSVSLQYPNIIGESDRIIAFLKDRPLINRKGVEIAAGMPVGTFRLSKRVTRQIPEKHIENIKKVLYNYGYKDASFIEPEPIKIEDKWEIFKQAIAELCRNNKVIEGRVVVGICKGYGHQRYIYSDMLAGNPYEPLDGALFVEKGNIYMWLVVGKMKDKIYLCKYKPMRITALRETDKKFSPTRKKDSPIKGEELF